MSPSLQLHQQTAPTCLQGTPVVPGRDLDLRCSPLQPEQDFTVWMHILRQTPDHRSIHKRSILLKPRAGSSQRALRPHGSQKRCAAFILHRAPVPKFPPEKSRTGGSHVQREHAGVCQHGGCPRCQIRHTIICQNSRDNIYSIHPQSGDVLNEARPSPINSCHPSTKTEPANFLRVSVHSPAGALREQTSIQVSEGNAGAPDPDKRASVKSVRRGFTSAAAFSRRGESDGQNERLLRILWVIPSGLLASSRAAVLTLHPQILSRICAAPPCSISSISSSRPADSSSSRPADSSRPAGSRPAGSSSRPADSSTLAGGSGQ